MIKRLIILVAVFVMMVSLPGCSSEGKKSESPSSSTVSEPKTTSAPHKDMTFEISDRTVRTLGRTLKVGEGNRTFYDWTCSGFEFTFTGTAVRAELGTLAAYAMQEKNRPHVVVYVDENVVPSADFLITQETGEYILAENLTDGTHTMRVLKASANVYSGPFYAKSVTVTGSNPSIVPTEPRARRIEFIGDSITCGYGTKASAPSGNYLSSEEDGSIAYAYLTAQALQADANIISVSGNGVYCDLNGRQMRLMPEYYQYTDLRLENDLGIQKKTPWDFNSFHADVVVVHLGTNDSNAVNNVSKPIGDSYPDYQTRISGFKKAYVDFLAVIRKNNPKAKIVCILGGMPCNLYSEMQKAVMEYKEKNGDSDVYAYEFVTSMYSVTDGIRAGHPSAQVHRMMQQELTEQIRKITGW
ncbi:MAG TPA: SGNH/GDSL hydrolase family protein [Clostridiales bacterium]|nr:SGNH/GDSL hydrolase family protein [Clostridiales bacterium]